MILMLWATHFNIIMLIIKNNCCFDAYWACAKGLSPRCEYDKLELSDKIYTQNVNTDNYVYLTNLLGDMELNKVRTGI